MDKICIFGGTFNPIHNGHIGMVDKVRDLYGFSKIVILPTGDSYLKKDVLPSDIRYEMTSLVTSEYDYMEISDIETRREGPSYTADTLEEFSAIYPKDELFFLIGEDSVRYIDKWYNPKKIFNLANIIVAGRKSGSEDIQEIIDNLKNHYLANISYFSYCNPTSSSEIRALIKAGKYDEAKKLVPDKIYDFIIEKGLYR